MMPALRPFLIYGWGLLLLTGGWYLLLQKENEITQLKIEIPQLVNSIKTLQEENNRLQFEIDRLEDPRRLLTLSQQAAYQYLTYPLAKDIQQIVIPSDSSHAP